MAEQYIGAVDGFTPPDKLRGWVRPTQGGGSPAEIRVFYENVIIAKGITGIYRVDVAGDYGFEAHLDRPILIEDISKGHVRVEAWSFGNKKADIPIFDGLLKRLNQQILDKSTSDSDILLILKRYASSPTSALRKKITECLPYFERNMEDMMMAGAPSNNVSFFGLPCGLKSPNQIAVVGRSGYLFVLNGNNKLFEQYQYHIDDDFVIKQAKAWLDIFTSRMNRLSDNSCSYLQIIIPEKSSVLSDLFPVDIKSPTALLKKIEESIRAHKQLSKSYVFCYDVMSADNRKHEIFRNLDTHMAAYGNLVLFSKILEHLGFILNISVEFTRSAVFSSDLGDMFPGVPMREVLRFPEADRLSDQESGLVRVEDFQPPDGKHVGARCVWVNSTAPLKKRIVVFGNSFFENGANAACLSWWFARWFSEFHFLWSPEIDYDYINNVKPDIVLCQTIERFLPIPPDY